MSYAAGADALSPFGGSAQQVAEQGLKGPSSPVDQGLAGKIASTTGVDVSHGRKHTGPAAQEACEALGAEGFTLGNDTAFASANPSTHTELHEYAHLAQQTGVSRPSAQAKGAPDMAPSADLEVQADQVADAAMAGKSAGVSVGQTPSVKLKRRRKKKKTKKKGEKDWVDDFAQAHNAEIHSIIKYLRGHTSDEDCMKVLRTLRHWSMTHIRACWYAIARKESGWLGDFTTNVGSKHFKAYPREVYASFKALNPKYAWNLVKKLADTGVFDWGVSEEEAHNGFLLLRAMPAGWADKFRAKYPKKWKAISKNLPSSAEADLNKAIDPKKEQQLYQQEKKRQTDAKAEAEAMKKAGGALKAIIKKLETGFTDWAVSDSEAIAVHSEFITLMGSADSPDLATVGAVVRKLETKGFVDKWLDNLPDKEKYGKGNKVAALITVMRVRPPESSLNFINSLLSKGLFDWAVTESEAKLAYYLIRQQPPSVQAMFRQQDNGFWLKRMESSLNAEVVDGKQPSTVNEKGEKVEDAGYGTFSSDAELEQAQKSEKAFKGRVDAYKEIRGLLQKGDKKSLTTAFDKLVAESDGARQGMVRRLDATGLIESMFKELGLDYLWDSGRRHVTLKILVARDPQRSAFHVEELTKGGWFDAVTATEAYLAFQLIKSMPKDYRDRLSQAYPEAWSKIMGEVNSSMKQSDDFNLYTGGKDGSDRQSILSQLNDKKLWAGSGGADLMQLENVLRMAIAAGHRIEANKTAIRMEAFKNRTAKEPNALMGKLGFFAKEEHIKGDGLEANKWWDEGLLQSIKEGGTAFIQGLDLLFKTDKIGLAISAIHAEGITDWSADVHLKLKGLPLDEAQQAMGGDIKGIKFAKSQDGDKDGKGAVNKIDADIDYINGIAYIKVDAPEIQIESVNTFVGENKVQSGPIVIKGVKLRVAYDVEKRNKIDPSGMHLGGKDPNANHRDHALVEVQSVTAGDILFITPSSMIAAKKFSMSELKAEMHEIPVPPEMAGKKEKGKDAALAQLKFVPETMAQSAGGLEKGKAQTPEPGQGMMSLAVGNLAVEGLTTSSGYKADKAELKDFELKVSNLPSQHAKNKMALLDGNIERWKGRIDELGKQKDKSAIDTHELDRLKEQIKAAEKQKTELAGSLPDLQKKESRYLELYQKQRSAAELNEKELEEFTQLSKTMQIGATVSVGEIDVKGIGTKPGERMGNANVKGISGSMDMTGSTEGQSNNLPGLTSLSHSVGMAGMVNAPKKEDQKEGKVPDAKASSNLELNVDRIHASNIKVPGSIPDYKDMCAKLTALIEASDKGQKLSDDDQAKRDKLEKWWDGKTKDGKKVGDVVTQLLEMEQSGDTTSAAYVALRETLRGPETTVGEIDLRGAKVSASTDVTVKNETVNGKTSVGLSVAEASIKDVKHGDKGVKSITATDLSVGGAADLVNVTKDGLGQSDMSGHVKAGTLNIKGIQAGNGLTIDEVSAKGFEAGASTKEGGKASVGFDEFSVKGVKQTSELKRLEQRVAELEKKKERTEAEDKELQELKDKKQVYDADRARLEVLAGEIKALERKVKRAKGMDKSALEGELDAKKAAFKKMKGRLDAMTTEINVNDVTLKDMSIEASGLGNPLLDGYEWTDRDIALKVSLGELGIKGVDYVSGDMVVKAPDASMKGFLVDVNVKVTKNKETGKHELAVGSKLNLFKIDELAATNLHMEMPLAGEKLVVDVPSASLTGLEAKKIPLDDFSPKTLSGEIKVDKVRAEAKAELGKKLSASGRLAVDDLSVKGYKDGKTEFNLGNLTLDKLKAKGSKLPAGFKTAALTNLSANATLDRNTGEVGFTVGLGSFTVDGINYSGKKGVVTAKQAAVKGVHLTGSAKINPDLIAGKESEGKKALESLKIKLFKIDTIEGTELGYDDGAGVNVKLKRGYFEDIKLQDFDLNKKTFDFNMGKAGITGLEADVSKTLKKHGKLVVKANATASVSGISVKKGSDGKVNFGMVKAELEKLGLSGSFKGYELKKASIDGQLGKIEGSVAEDGTVEANLAKSGIAAKGLITGPDGTNIDLAASLKGLQGSFKYNPDGSFSTTVGLDSVGLDSLDAKHNQGHIKTGTAGIKGMSVTLKGGVGPDPKDPSKKKLSTITVESFKMDEAAVNSLDLHHAPLNLKVKAPKAGIYGIWAKGIKVDLNTKQILEGGSAGVKKLDSGKISTEVGSAIKANGQLTATDFQIDFLKGGKHSWTLDQLSMKAGVVSTDGYSGGINNFQLNTVTGTDATDDGSYQVGVKSGSGRMTGQGDTKSVTIPGSDGKGPTPEEAAAAKKKGKLEWSLPFLDNLTGALGIQLPVHASDARVALAVRNGELLYSVPAASLKLPFEEMWGFMIPKWASVRLLSTLLAAIRDFYKQVFGSKPSWLRKKVEDGLNKESKPEKSDDLTIDLNQLSADVVDKVGRAGFMVDILAPNGHGVSGTLKEGLKDAAEGTMGGILKGADWIGKKTGIGRVGVVKDGSVDRYHKQKDQEKEARRRQLVLDWIRKIKLGLKSTANGGANATRHPEGKKPFKFLTSTIDASINAPTSDLENKLNLSIGATATGIKLTDPNYSAELKEFKLEETNVSAGVGKDGTMSAKAGVGFTFDGLTVNIPKKAGKKKSG